MDALDLASLAKQETSIQSDRREAARLSEAQVLRHDTKVHAVSRAMKDLEYRHKEELAALRAKEQQEAAAIKARTQRKLRELESQRQALSQRREEVQAETRRMVRETEDIKGREADKWTQVQQEAASADRHAMVALQDAQESVSAAATAASRRAQGVLEGLRVDCHRAWEPTREWGQAMQAVLSARRESGFDQTYTPRAPARGEAAADKTCAPPRPLPFGGNEWPFDGYGTYGKKPASVPTQGFREETLLRLHERSRLPGV
mmetsp:Transcript_46383/g.138664  ORF Transcript_46383/g.138664 Transcript_46383/m.138664 type:complete len:261 (+) Transcript_46383:49-831(+)